MLEFPGNLATSGVSDGLMCVPASSSSSKRNGFRIPGDSRKIADAVITAVNEAPLTDFESFGTAVDVGQSVVAHASKVRDTYYRGLADIQAIWEKSPDKNTLELSTALSEMRNKVRTEARVNSQISAWGYEIIDKYNDSEAKQRRISQKIAEERYLEVEKSSFRGNPAWTDRIKLVEKGLKRLNRLNNVATVVSIGAPAAEVFVAKTADEEFAALKKFYRASGGALSGFAGGVTGGFLCVALGVSTMGYGFLMCGAMVGAVGFAGNIAGEEAGEQLFTLVGSENLVLLRKIKSGPTKPLMSNP